MNTPAYANSAGYTALGLAANPFAAEQQPGVAPQLWITRDDQPPAPQPRARHLVQLIGPRGAGKTSLLLHWRQQQPGPYHYVAPGIARWRMPPFAPLVFWDEVDRMAAPVRALALRIAAFRHMTIVAGTHRDLTPNARRAGLAVTTHIFAPLSAELLQQWAERRIAQVRLPNATHCLSVDQATAERIVAQVGESWRDAAVLLHVWVAQQAAKSAQSRLGDSTT